MEKRLILAIALSLSVVFGFNYLFPAKKHINTQPVSEHSVTVETRAQISIPAEIGKGSVETNVNEEEHLVASEKFDILFSNIGGAIKEIRLKEYTTPGEETLLKLSAPPSPPQYMTTIIDPLNIYQLSNVPYELVSEGNRITYTLKLPTIDIQKIYTFNDSYMFNMTVSIRNKSELDQQITYRIVAGSGIVEKDKQDQRYIEATSNIDDKITAIKRPKQGTVINKGKVYWAALKNKYFSIIMHPVEESTGVYSEDAYGEIVIGLEMKNVVLPPRSYIEQKFVFYAGPSDIKKLKAVGFGFEESISYGVFGAISVFLLNVMKFFYSLTKSWGVSIILLSVSLNIALFPLTFASFKSMHKMQTIQPLMEKLKEQHKSNPQRLNKETMELYKSHGVNPFSGCLPLLLQMPIFIGLYNGLMRLIDLKNAKFLWIQDLSMPDALKLPGSIPALGGSVNILPILMAVAMAIQQKLSTAATAATATPEQRQQQKIMLIVMPIMFGFIFYNMPSGLVLYWFISTILTSAEQTMMMKKAK